MAKFFTSFTHSKTLPLPPDYDEPTPDLQLVRPLSVEQQVEQFLAAGRNLEAYRNLGFDFSADDDIDEDLDDPTRDPDFDLIDAAVAERDFALKMQSMKRKEKTNNDSNDKKSDSSAESSADKVEKTSATEVDNSNQS